MAWHNSEAGTPSDAKDQMDHMDLKDPKEHKASKRVSFADKAQIVELRMTSPKRRSLDVAAAAEPATKTETAKDRSPSVKLEEDTPPSFSPQAPLRKGDQVDYHSDTLGWLKSSVIEVRDNGDIKVGVKPSKWLNANAQAAKVRLSGSVAAEAMSIGAEAMVDDAVVLRVRARLSLKAAMQSEDAETVRRHLCHAEAVGVSSMLIKAEQNRCAELLDGVEATAERSSPAAAAGKDPHRANGDLNDPGLSGRTAGMRAAPRKSVKGICRFGARCNRADCWFDHPAGRAIDASSPTPLANSGPDYSSLYRHAPRKRQRERTSPAPGPHTTGHPRCSSKECCAGHASSVLFELRGAYAGVWCAVCTEVLRQSAEGIECQEMPPSSPSRMRAGQSG